MLVWHHKVVYLWMFAGELAKRLESGFRSAIAEGTPEGQPIVSVLISEKKAQQKNPWEL